MAKNYSTFAALVALICFLTVAAKEEKCSLKKVRLDAIFVVDGSFSIKPVNFKQGLEFVANFVDFLQEQGLDTGDDGARIGVVEYSTPVKTRIPLEKITSGPLLKSQILNIPQSDQQTYTGDALKEMQSMFDGNPRNDTLRLGFVLTDGVCSRENRPVLRKTAAELHAADVTMYALGVGNDTSVAELKRIAGVEAAATNSTNNRVFQVDDYDSLDGISKSLFTTVCIAIQTEWKESLFAKKEFYLPVGFVALIVIVVVVVAVVLWRLSILARRKYLLNQLDEAKNELRKSQTDINRLYLNPRTTVNLEDIVGGGAGGGGAAYGNSGRGGEA